MCLACDWAKYLGPQEPSTHADVQPVPTKELPTGTVFKNGVVHTVVAGAARAQAVAVEGDTIVYVGDDAGVAAFETPGVRVVDLGGRMLMPGFVEGHIHPFVGSAITRGVDLQFDTREEMLAALEAYRDADPDMDVVRGFGWRYTGFPATGPVKEDLDAIWPDAPVLLIAIDGHSAWVNSKALELAGVDADTPDPQPGFSFFQRVPDTGAPTGWLVEVGAMFQVIMTVAPYTAEYIETALAEWMPKASAAGITSVFDAGVIIMPEEDAFALYGAFERAGTLPFRVVASFYHFDPSVDPIPIVVDLRTRFDSELVQGRVLKINVDGGDVQYTAAMLHPYSDDPTTSGETILPPDILHDTVARADREGIDMHFHAIGDRAIRVTLDALEHAIAANPAWDRRHTLAHLVLVDDADLPRFAELGAIGQFSAQWAVPDDFFMSVTSARWGPVRSSTTYRYGSHRRSGARLTLGTDWPAASHYSTYKPLEAIQVAMTRQEIGKEATSEPLAPADERITLEEAIRANTIDAAFQLRLDDKVGTIEVGKKADLIVLDRDIFALEPSEIGAAQVVMTLVNGVIRHETAS